MTTLPVLVNANEIAALSKRVAKATEGVRDLRSKLAFEQKRQLERGREIDLEKLLLKAQLDDGQSLA